MSKFLYRLGSWSYRKVWPFLAFWLMVLVAMAGLTAGFAKSPNPNFSMPEMDSTITQDKMMERFGQDTDAMSAPEGTVVIQAPEGKDLTDKQVAGKVDDLLSELKDTGALKDQDKLVSPVMAAAGMEKQMGEKMKAQHMPEEQIQKNLQQLSPLSEDKTTGTVTITFNANEVMDIPEEDMTKVTDVLNKYDEGELTVKYQGNAFSSAGQEMGGSAEIIGLIVAAIVLLITFGSFVAAGMPLISAIIGVGIGILGVQVSTVFTDTVSDMTPTLASMIGLAVGIDYALFIVNRFRNELITSSGLNDLSPKELAQELKKMDKATRAHAMGMALGTAGGSVVFAGTTVVIALAALTIIGIPFLGTMAIAAAATVIIAVLVANTFIPALLGLLGTKIFAGRVPGPQGSRPRGRKAHHGPALGTPRACPAVAAPYRGRRLAGHPGRTICPAAPSHAYRWHRKARHPAARGL